METIKLFFELLERTWNKIKEISNSIFNARRSIEKESKLRSSWLFDWDTRRNSQVTNRKPAFAIQKII